MNRAEFSLIEWIRSRVIDRDPVKLGIGDDAAILRSTSDRDWLLATDMLMEGTDFTFPPATARLAGRKALAVNLSDIAAMGGRATAAFVSVALPIDRGVEFAKDLHAGLLDLADQYDVVLAGGDTNSWHGPLVINVAVVGEPTGSRSVTRQGAKPGDWIFVTGTLGGSITGHHLTFEPRLREAAKLISSVDVHAMMDISDGLAADLHHLLDQSHVGATIDATSIPVSDIARLMTDGVSPLVHALSDGEDFELVFTVAEADGQRLLSDWQDVTPICCIGRVTAETGCWLELDGGQRAWLPPMGWSHALKE
ncbi:MAG TPA: thiamine-phosphate kinase [Schlesneria sp.]